MDRQDLSAAMIQERGAVFTAALDDALPALLGRVPLGRGELRIEALVRGRVCVRSGERAMLQPEPRLGRPRRGRDAAPAGRAGHQREPRCRRTRRADSA